VSLDLGPNIGREIVARMIIESDVGALARKDIADRRSYSARAAGNESALTF
jgi:hypothetical protein